ncbi:lectin [Hamadaea tsunoensis]|uniref:lectin n=1 Tax=Hamadaea tsunoensis TaxID=53368 RepID=UPI000428456F|nr:lectin [Hamadaea tsunoensis]
MATSPLRRLSTLASALAAGLWLTVAGLPSPAQAAVADPASVVNPFLGTSNGGNTFPGADVPFGMVQWSPDTNSRPDGGGYAYADSTITGFSLTHMSGPGCNGGASDIPIMPTTGAVSSTATSSFSHANESANAGYYKVALGNGVTTELTATQRSGMGRFTFPSTTQANLVFKLSSGDNTGATSFTVVNSTEVSGTVVGGHFCGASATYTLYFDVLFDRAFASSGTFTGGGSVTFNTTSSPVVQAKVGLSYVSTANAAANRTAENPNWNFASTQSAAHTAWNNQLGKIQISGGTTNQQVVFYTSLYHALLHPNVESDSNGQYLGFDNQVHTLAAGQQAQYANYSGWDIYRAQAQLMALVAPQQASDSAQSMINDYAQSGTIPKWTQNNGETYVMVGDPGSAIIADYYAFGARAFDTAAAKAAMIHSGTVANNTRPGLDYLSNSGYLPSDGAYGCCNFYGSVSTALEYNTADFAVSAYAGALGDTTTQSQFRNRAQAWRNMFNSGSGFMQPKLAGGAWKGGFSATSGTDFVEGTSWQYTGMVPFNVAGLAAAKGGNAAYQTYLNNVLADFHGSGGSHADLGNEPSVELPWQYDYVGQPWKTQQVVRQVQDQLWPNSPANWGVGNDDLGTMSAWYVFSALGFFPETPGTADLALGSPMFTSISIALGGGGTISISAPQAADNAPYVQSATLNGAAWNNAYLPPSFVTGGGTLAFTLGTTANTGWATGASAAPPSYDGDGGAQPPYGGEGPTGALKSGIAGYCLDVANSSTADGAKVQVYSCNGTNAQRVTVPGDGSLQVLGKCLDVDHSGTANNTLVQLWTCNGSGAQKFTYSATTKALTNPQSGRCLDDPGGSTSGAQLVIYDCNGGTNQQWTIPAPGPIASGLAGKCVDDDHSGTANGNKIQIWTCNGTVAQAWTVTAGGTLQVFGKCMDVTGSGTANGTKVQLYQCNGSGAQKWTYNATTKALTNPQSGRCLDDPGSSTTDGTQLQIYDCNGTTAQQWTIPS